MTSFHETLALAKRALTTRLMEESYTPPPGLMANLFAQGHAVGLTDKEIIKALLKPVAGQLRPSARRA